MSPVAAINGLKIQHVQSVGTVEISKLAMVGKSDQKRAKEHNALCVRMRDRQNLLYFAGRLGIRKPVMSVVMRELKSKRNKRRANGGTP